MGTNEIRNSAKSTGKSTHTVSAEKGIFPPYARKHGGRINVRSMMFEPRIFPTDRDACFFVIAEIVVTSSGREVPTATAEILIIRVGTWRLNQI